MEILLTRCLAVEGRCGLGRETQTRMPSNISSSA